MPVSALNTIRRDAVQQLELARAEAFARPLGRQLPPENIADISLPREKLPAIEITHGTEPIPCGEGKIQVWYPDDWREEALCPALDALKGKIWLHLPSVCEEDTIQAIGGLLRRYRDRIEGVMLGSVGQLGLELPEGMEKAAGPGIPVMNRQAAMLLFEEGCRFVTASCELDGEQTQTLMAQGAAVAVPVYGRAQLMILHHCPARTYLRFSAGHAGCRLCDNDHPDALKGTTLTDRRGQSFSLRRLRLPEGCLVRVMNTVTTDVRRRTQGWPGCLCDLREDDAAGGVTSGHWNRPVE